MKCSNLANGSVSFSWFHWRKELHYRILLVCVSTAAAAVPSISFNRDSFIIIFFYLIFFMFVLGCCFSRFYFFICCLFMWKFRSVEKVTSAKRPTGNRRKDATETPTSSAYVPQPTSIPSMKNDGIHTRKKWYSTRFLRVEGFAFTTGSTPKYSFVTNSSMVIRLFSLASLAVEWRTS